MYQEFSKIPADTFKKLGVNAAMILSAFTPSSGAYEKANIIGATTGGITFTATPEYEDYGEDVDNCPKNTKELKRLVDWDVTCSGSFVTMDAALAKRMTAAADNTDGHIVPRSELDVDNDFSELWIVGDYSDVNTSDTTSGKTAGFIAIHLMNALNTGGFKIKTSDKEKMTFDFEFTCHFSLDAQDTVPFEIYIKAGSASNS